MCGEPASAALPNIASTAHSLATQKRYVYVCSKRHVVREVPTPMWSGSSKITT